MDEKYTLGIYSYHGKINTIQFSKLPEQLKMNNISANGVLLKLLMGKIRICDRNDDMLFNQKVNYTVLPYERETSHSYRQFNKVLGIDVNDDESRELCDKFFLRDRRNKYVYEHMLNEITQYFVVKDISPCEGFVHLYRTLEFMSYSFPLIYASKSKDYRGSYESMKKFFKGGEGMGELKFLGYFLKELFADEQMMYDFEFEILFDIEEVDILREDFHKSIKMDLYTFENNTLNVKFSNIKDIFVEMRNKYFHMLIGQGNNNFLDMDYNKNDLFRCLNPVFLNWISCIYIKIIQHGLSLYD
ncbi:hypothetical protein ACTQ1L_01480 [Agathobacter sp. LCP21S3_B2]|uniref:hypothetical protein n=1 Tax=Agathobacter sp. LCP21S3_B2 TaxID=3438734 RepID=UPI003F8DD19A